MKDNPAGFERFGVQWTPVTVITDPNGKERYRFEGFLPVEEYLPQVEFGLAKTAFESGNLKQAEEQFRRVVEDHPEADIAPEALYWAGVVKYKSSGDAAALHETAAAFSTRYTNSVWAKKASIWRA